MRVLCQSRDRPMRRRDRCVRQLCDDHLVIRRDSRFFSAVRASSLSVNISVRTGVVSRVALAAAPSPRREVELPCRCIRRKTRPSPIAPTSYNFQNSAPMREFEEPVRSRTARVAPERCRSTASGAAPIGSHPFAPGVDPRCLTSSSQPMRDIAVKSPDIGRDGALVLPQRLSDH